ncbi:hypothetical protein GCM10027572_19670 [Flexivirga lutea]
MPSSRFTVRRVAAAVAVATLAGAGSGWVVHATAARSTALPPAALASAPSASGAAAAPSPSDGGAAAAQTSAAAAEQSNGEDELPAPSHLTIRRLGISMRVIPRGVSKDGQMAIPADPDTVGWYEYGPKPGAPQGTPVLAAHIDADGYGLGPFARLVNLRRGDRVDVTAGRTKLSYRVQTVTAIAKPDVDLPNLFATTGSPQLHLVTCGGSYDYSTHHYRDNIVVTAVPLAS